MESLDVFESTFRRALRDPYTYAIPPLDPIVLVSDLNEAETASYEGKARMFLGDLLKDAPIRRINGDSFSKWSDLKRSIDEAAPGLIITYRLLHEPHDDTKFSLGAYLDTLAQESDSPILVLPPPERFAPQAPCKSVLAATNHLSGDDSLVNWGARMTPSGGSLTLAHLEDEDAFRYFLNAIERIPELNTDIARETIPRQLLAQPRKYLTSVIETLRQRRSDLKLDSIVETAHIVDRYRQILGERTVDLLILESKDDTQLAMHSLGYSLAVEFKKTPLLLL